MELVQVTQFGRNAAGQPVFHEMQGTEVVQVAQFRWNAAGQAVVTEE